MSMRLREMIKLIRETKTAAEERDIVAKECADIRTSFKKEENDLRARNICKLIYCNLLGYATHFAQMDCLKLVVSNNYSDKRVGYLGLMMLMDERNEVLMLVTNSLKNDLRHVNQYVVGLALATIGNIASAELARDCAPEVEKLLDSPNPYIRKKAALAAVRILRKVPDLMDQFVPKVRGLITEKNHGVLITGTVLMIEMCRLDPTVIEGFRKLVPHLVRVFSSLLQYGFSPEYDVGGVTDPFLQVKILRLLRILGQDNPEASDAMNVILAGVATNTDNVKNVGNSILYECVNTIMGIDSEAGLRVLAINTLGRFLSNRDNNIRYVALNTLCTVVNIDTEAVQRHRNIVVDCLKDNDISIRRRALELVYSLVNTSNVRVLVRELINFLQVADIEFRADLTAKLCMVAEKYAPTSRWHVDTILRVMTIAGDYVPDATSNALLALIAQNPDIHAYAVQKMYLALQTDLTQQTLVRAAVWCIGEFGDLLLNPPSTTLLQDANEEEEAVVVKVSEAEILQLFRNILSNVATRTSTKRQVLTALLKLTVRMPSCVSELHQLVSQFETHINVELQQRATEYDVIMTNPSLPPQLLSRIPPPEIKTVIQPAETVQKKPRESAPAAASSRTGPTSIAAAPAPAQPVNLLDMDLMSLSIPSTTSNPAATTFNPMPQPDILASLFSNQAAPSVPSTTQPSSFGLNPVPVSQPAPIIDLLTSDPVSSAPPTSWPNIPIYKSNDGLSVVFDISKPQPSNPQFTLINATYANNGSQQITDFELKVSLPKYLKLQMPPATSTMLQPGGISTQQIKLANSLQGQKGVMMRLMVEYKLNGEARSQLVEPTLPEGI